MEQLSDQLLVDTYYAAIEFRLDADFIRLLAYEIKRRNIELNPQKNTA